MIDCVLNFINVLIIIHSSSIQITIHRHVTYFIIIMYFIIDTNTITEWLIDTIHRHVVNVIIVMHFTSGEIVMKYWSTQLTIHFPVVKFIIVATMIVGVNSTKDRSTEITIHLHVANVINGVSKLGVT